MKNKELELIAISFIDNEIKQFTVNEFKALYFELCGNDVSPAYLENKAYASLRLLLTLKCIKLVGSGTAKIYEINLNQIKKVFPEAIKEIKFYKEKKAVK